MMIDGRNQVRGGGMEAERSLAVRASGGSAEAFTELVKRLDERLFNFLLRRVGRRADAEDLTQETFLRAWRHIGRYEPRHAFSTWLFTIGSRLAMDLMQSAERVRMRTGMEVESRMMGAEEGEDGREDSREGGGKLWALAGRLLGEEQHAALWLRYAEGCTVKDVAEILGKGQVHVRVMLHRARRVLADHAEEVRRGRDGQAERKEAVGGGGEDRMMMSTGSAGGS